MQFVNISHRPIYTSLSGPLNPGRVSSDGGAERRKLEETLSEIVRICDNVLGIRLNSRETQLLNQLMELDEKGSGFSAADLPAEVRDDPTGEKRNAASVRAAQQREHDARIAANEASAARERLIDGEPAGGPVGPATLKGEKVDPGKLKSAFERIMEENARIASGKRPEKLDVKEALDPIGAHAMKGGAQTRLQPDEKAVQGGGHIPQVPASGNAMDRQAADFASGFATMGPTDARNRKTKAKKAK